MSEYLTLFSSPELKDVVQDMRQLLSQSHLASLIRAGCSKNAGLPLMPELTKALLVHNKIGEETKKLLDTIRQLFSGSEDAPSEDFMSEIVDLLSIAERRTQSWERMIGRFLPEGHAGGVLLTPTSGCAWAR